MKKPSIIIYMTDQNNCISCILIFCIVLAKVSILLTEFLLLLLE